MRRLDGYDVTALGSLNGEHRRGTGGRYCEWHGLDRQVKTKRRPMGPPQRVINLQNCARYQGTELTGWLFASKRVRAPAPSELSVSAARVLPSVLISASPGNPSGVTSRPTRPRC